MSNEDLLAGLTPAAEPAKRRPGRPAKPVVLASTKETLPDIQGGVTDAGLNAGLVIPDAGDAPEATGSANYPPLTAMNGDTLTDANDPAPFTAEQEAKIAAELAKFDAKVNSLTPVSVDYTLAMANRITQIGGKREYAYQRILRHGKKL